jgi:hypothetical protein
VPDNAEALTRQSSSGHAAKLATALDIALLEYGRRYGDVRFRVVEMRTTSHGVEFTVAPY